jgi:hypothetical protein
MPKILILAFIKEISRKGNNEEIEDKGVTEEMAIEDVVVEEEAIEEEIEIEDREEIEAREDREGIETIDSKEVRKRNMWIKKQVNNLKTKNYSSKEFNNKKIVYIN